MQRKDGSWGGVILFDITPGFAIHGGIMSQNAQTSPPITGAFDIRGTVIWLDPNEPRQVEQLNYYKGAYLTLGDGPYAGSGKKDCLLRLTYSRCGL